MMVVRREPAKIPATSTRQLIAAAVGQLDEVVVEPAVEVTHVRQHLRLGITLDAFCKFLFEELRLTKFIFRNDANGGEAHVISFSWLTG